MHVLFTIHSLLKKGGGTSAVVQNFSGELSTIGVDVTILTHEPANGEAEAFPNKGNVRLVYVPSNGKDVWGTEFRRRMNSLMEHQPVDLVQDFGLWLSSNHASASLARQRGVPYLNAVSGMLAKWALQHRSFKKKIAWWLYQLRDLQGAALLTASSAQELVDVHHQLPGKEIAVIPNGIEFPFFQKERRPDNDRKLRNVVFLGRIHPVKGLMNLVEAWAMIRPKGWRCIIAGPNEAGYQAVLEEKILKYGLGDSFEFPGLMDSEQKWKLLADANLFVLPSYTENFGISAAEALAASVPVITTIGTPWKDLVEYKCGWWIEVGSAPLASALTEAMGLSEASRIEMGLRGCKLVQQRYNWNRIAGLYLQSYEWVLKKGKKPAFIS